MNVVKSLLLTATALGLPALVPALVPDGSNRKDVPANAGQQAPRGEPGRALPPLNGLVGDCDGAALALLDAARSEANRVYWIRLANCLNDPTADLPTAERKLAARLEADLARAQAQYEARLALCGEIGTGPYDPQLDPDDFSSKVDNERFPLVRRRTLVYEKKGAAGVERMEATTLNDTRVIDGFECRAVGCREWIDGELVEDTIDWYAQRSDGTVWYFGELTKEFEDGLLVSIAGSWMAGRDGAKPGIVMLAKPAEGDSYRQEFLPGEAEDVARVISEDETVVLPIGTFTGCVEIEDWSPLGLEGPELKYFAPGIGMVLEIDVNTGERLELIKIK